MNSELNTINEIVDDPNITESYKYKTNQRQNTKDLSVDNLKPYTFNYEGQGNKSMYKFYDIDNQSKDYRNSYSSGSHFYDYEQETIRYLPNNGNDLNDQQNINDNKYIVNKDPVSISSSRLYRSKYKSDIQYDVGVKKDENMRDVTSKQGISVYNVDYIVVYLLTDRCKDKHVASLIRFFEYSSFYKLHVVDIPPPAIIDRPVDITDEQAIEIYRFNYVLTKARKMYPNNYVMVLKDKTVTVTSPDILEDVIRTAVNLAGWQLCYLNRWLDACDQYTNRVDVKNNQMISLVKTISPNSTQSILFSPEGRDIVIGKCKMNNGEYFTPIRLSLGEKFNIELERNNMTAICSVPNIFVYNLFDARSVTDIAKLSECRRPLPKPDNSDVGTIPFILFVLSIIAVFVILWALYILGPSNRRQDKADIQVEVTSK